MKVGDLVKGKLASQWGNDATGIVLMMSGPRSRHPVSACCFWADGDTRWYACDELEVVSEGR